jgi:hypothetical protein
VLTPSARRRFFAIGVTVASLALVPPAAAQSTAQFPVQFNFLTPGARSMAMGGAFIGAADDATAAFSNPAGLAFFGTVQVTFEGRGTRFETPFLAGGRVSGQTTGIGLDTIPGPVYEHDYDGHVRPSFAAVVIPFGGRSSFTAYRHELADIANQFYSRGAFQRASFFGIVDDGNRDTPLGGRRSIRIATYGGAVGRSFKGERLALGGGLSVSTFRVDSRFARFGFVSSIFGPDDPTIVSATAVQTGDGAAVSGNVGAIWRSSGNRVSIGAVYRRGPSFTFTQNDRVPAADFSSTRVGRFKVPDVYAAGVAWATSERLRVLFDYDRVQYSQVKADFIDFQAIASGRSSRLSVADADEVHGGVEYRTVVHGRPFAWRTGAWFDPDHSVRYTPTAAMDEFDALLSASLRQGKNLVHYTGGIGIGLPGRTVFDAAADLSARTRAVTASFLVRF